jgi:predicted branched-subunit amino acid permease
MIPMGAFTIPFGTAFGVVATETGMSVPQAIAMSAFAFSGAAQFAALDFRPSPIALGSLAIVVLALNARHAVMGAALSHWVNRLGPWRRVLALSVLSDATFADSQAAFRAGERDVGVLLGGGLALWSAWVAGTIVAVTGGAVLVEPGPLGIDVVMASFFVAVLVGQARGNRACLAPILAASAASVATFGWLPTGWNVILGALVGAFAGILRRGA